MRAQRVLCLSVHDWPVLAVQRAHGVPSDQPLGVLAKGRVVACSASARAVGVRVGLRMREAQARCPEIDLYSYDPDLDRLQFEPFVAAVEAVVPGVEVLRPGVCLLAVAGAARYYGDERRAADAVLEVTGGLPVGAGVADDPFTAEQAAEQATEQAAVRTGETPVVVPSGGSPAFLAPLDVGVLDRGLLAAMHSGGPDTARLVPLLRRLGVRSLGGFAALPATAVRDRFGDDGETAHAQASGRERRRIEPRVPPETFARTVVVDPALSDVEPLLSVAEPVLSDLVAALGRGWLACTEVTLTLTTEEGRVCRRTWRHPRWFAARDLADRIRWQVTEWAVPKEGAPTSDIRDGIARIEVDPVRVEPAADHDGGLWGGAPEEKVQHVVSGLQSTLGREAVLTPALVGGRAPAKRQSLVAWGEPHDGPPADRPWPAALPKPAPASVFGRPLPCRVHDGAGAPVRVTDRGVLDGSPGLLASGRAGPVRGLEITAWAGPWPVDDRWWESDALGPTARLQVQDAEGVGWLLLQVSGEWYLEARYD